MNPQKNFVTPTVIISLMPGDQFLKLPPHLRTGKKTTQKHAWNYQRKFDTLRKRPTDILQFSHWCVPHFRESQFRMDRTMCPNRFGYRPFPSSLYREREAFHCALALLPLTTHINTEVPVRFLGLRLSSSFFALHRLCVQAPEAFLFLLEPFDRESSF